MYTYSTPAEDIGVPCQAEEFDIENLCEHFIGQPDDSDVQTDKLTRVSLIRKRAPMADILDLEEIEEKIQQYCQLLDLYAKASCELSPRRRKPTLAKCWALTSETSYSSLKNGTKSS